MRSKAIDSMFLPAGMLPPAKKWKFLTLCKMKKIINKVEKGQKKMDIAEEYGIACSSLSTMLKNKAAILNALGSGTSVHS